MAKLPLPGTVPFEEYAPLYLRIRTKTHQVVPFVPNGPQLRLLRLIREIQLSGRPVRLIILKARQLGFSTLSLGLMYEFATGNSGVEAFLAAHDDESTEDLFERVRLMHDQAPMQPMTRYSNRRELDFSNPKVGMRQGNPGLLSKIRVGTAGKVNLGRSKTLAYVHCSEVAFWDKASRVLISLEQAIPDGPNTVEIIESTANGLGGEFYQRWKRAENPETRGDWRAVFFPWYEDPEYSRPLIDGIREQLPSSVVDLEAFEREERELAALYKLTPEQMNWRRWCIKNKCGDSLDTFHQEYPCTAEEAFLTTGRPVFNRARLIYRRRSLEAEDLRRRADRQSPRGIVGRLIRVGSAIRFEAHPQGELTIYKTPLSSGKYIIGGDTAEGMTKGKDPDACCGQVFERYSWEQVAVLYGRMTPSVFAEQLMLLGYWYGTALLVPEVNNHGHTVMTKIQDARYTPYYIRQEFDSIGKEVLDKPGWETNKRTRPMLVDALDSAINTNLVVLNDIATIDECLTFVRDEKTGKPQGDKDCHDDRVLAAGIAMAVMDWGPRVVASFSTVDPYKGLDTLSVAASKHVRRLVSGLMAERRSP